jgi:GTP-binding protein
MKPVVAIIGRANVGKSTLFNRLVGNQVAIIEDWPGTTRDRVFADASLRGHEVTLIDTGGLSPLPATSMDQKIKYQVEAAIIEANVIIFLVDIKDGLIPADKEIADTLRKSHKPLILAVNKADNDKLEIQASNFHQLGLGTPLPISAHHGRGINALIDALMPLLPEATAETIDPDIPKIAIVGKPNAGKSMLLNTLLGEERAIVDEVPGTTRDATDTPFTYKGRQLLLIDTAGIKKRGKSGTGIDYYSLIRSMRAISRCDVALLVIDATEFITAEDTHIAGYIKDDYKGVVLVINKWDLVSDVSEKEYADRARERLKFIAHAPILFVSAKLGQGVKKILPSVLDICHERQKKLADTVVNKLIKQAFEDHAPPAIGLRRLHVVKAFQNGINPPSFSFLVNDPRLVHFSYQRYLENRLRQTFGFYGTSLRFIFKKAPRKRREKTGGRKG